MTWNILNRLPSESPRRERDASAGPAHARDLSRGGFRAAGEHHPARRHHRIEAAIFERQILGVALLVVDRQLLGRGLRSAPPRADPLAMSTPVTFAPRRATTATSIPCPWRDRESSHPDAGSSRSTQCSIESAMPRLIAL